MDGEFSAFCQNPFEQWDEKTLPEIVNYNAATPTMPVAHSVSYLLDPHANIYSSYFDDSSRYTGSLAFSLPPLHTVPTVGDFGSNYSTPPSKAVFQREKAIPEQQDGLETPRARERGRKRNESSRGRKQSPSSSASEHEFIDTKKLVEEIAFQLKTRCIPQTLFAEKVLGRSQGTLSDLLKNPKPWNQLKSGRDTFKRMQMWLRMSEAQRMAPFINEIEQNGSSESELQLETNRKGTKRRVYNNEAVDNTPTSVKRPRLVFTALQKRTLDAIFEETQNPSRDMQQIIAERLKLEPSTVHNYFMNMRRRSKLSSD